MIFTYSAKGKARQAQLTLAIKYGVLDGTGSRLTLLNNWEATVQFDEKKLTGILDDTKNWGLMFSFSTMAGLPINIRGITTVQDW